MRQFNYFFIGLISTLLLLSGCVDSSISEENSFQNKSKVKKELIMKLDEWKAWKRTWYGPYPKNRVELFERKTLHSEATVWMKAKLKDYKIITIKSSYTPAYLKTDKNSIQAWALVKVTLNVAQKPIERYLEYYFYRVLDLYGVSGTEWIVTDVWMYDDEEVKKEIRWTNSVLAW